MSVINLGLEDLLSPTTPNEFLAETWERTPLAIARDEPTHYGELLTLRDVDQIISYTRPRFHDTSAFHPGPASRPTYVRGALDQDPFSATDNPGLAQIRQVFDQGKSLVLMAMQHRWPAIARLCRNLETVFRCPVHANMYLTPAGEQGFAAHFDPHEVFVLQLEGTKQWRLYEGGDELPLAIGGSGVPGKPLGKSREVRLKAGDFLYIPRGHVHEAFTSDTFSLHLTVGINVYRWADLLRYALTSISRRDVRFRESLREGALPVDRAQLKQQFQQLCERLADSAHRDEIFDEAWQSLGDQFFSQLQILPGSQFTVSANLDRLDLDTVLENPAPGLCRVVTNDQEVAIEFPGNRVAGPQRIASALHFICGARRFLVRSIPDDLNPQAKIVLARRLVREGLLTICEERPLVLPTISESGARELDNEAATAPTVFWDGLDAEVVRRAEEVNVEG